MRRVRFLSLACLCLVSIALLRVRPAADWVSPSVVVAQEKTNTYYAAQFPGADKFTKIANAQNSCTTPASFNMPCIIVVDSILAGWPAGTSFNPCSNCMWMDYASNLGGLTIVQGTGITSGLHLQLNAGSDDGGASIGNLFVRTIGAQVGFQPAIGSTLAPFGQISIGTSAHHQSTISAAAAQADRTTQLPDGNSATVIVASLTTTAATTDNVAVQGMTASGHCDLQPTNSAAAAGIASVFVSAKASNQITVTHTATSGWTFDVVCTAI